MSLSFPPARQRIHPKIILMNKAKIGLIGGIISNELKTDLWGTLAKVREIGYQAIEGGAMLLEGDAAGNLRRLHDLGLRVITHGAKREELRDNLAAVIADAQALGADNVTVWWAPCDSKEQLLEDARLFNETGRRLADKGLRLCYHNHDHEFRKTFDGLYGLEILAAHTDPACLKFELDVAWIAFGGEDPVRYLRKFAGRLPVIHLKDLASLTERGQFSAIGTGLVDIAGSVQTAVELGVEWVIVEQDRARNLTGLETITASYLNLKEMGLV
jgi:sugar phosphate isomerase/epimerase